jgi:hypothetical protein
MLRLPKYSSLQFKLKITYTHYGGLPAVSHSQLSFIGWGSNQIWDQSVIGAWRKSFVSNQILFKEMQLSQMFVL